MERSIRRLGATSAAPRSCYARLTDGERPIATTLGSRRDGEVVALKAAIEDIGPPRNPGQMGAFKDQIACSMSAMLPTTMTIQLGGAS